MLTCTKCKQEKPATREFFSAHRGKRNGLHSWCKTCKDGQWNRVNKGRFRSVMSDAELIAFKASRKKCDICEAVEPLVVDHCHSSGKVRGMLCQHCNRGLGHFRDNTKVMAQAIKYIKEAGHAA